MSKIKYVQSTDRFETVHIWSEDLQKRADERNMKLHEISKEKYDLEMQKSWNQD